MMSSRQLGWERQREGAAATDLYAQQEGCKSKPSQKTTMDYPPEGLWYWSYKCQQHIVWQQCQECQREQRQYEQEQGQYDEE